MSAQSTREWQIAAAAALSDLVPRDLPVACWVLARHIRSLEGQIGGDTAEETRAALAAWAEYLGGEVVEGSAPLYRQVTAEYMGVTVRMWGAVERTADGAA